MRFWLYLNLSQNIKQNLDFLTSSVRKTPFSNKIAILQHVKQTQNYANRPHHNMLVCGNGHSHRFGQVKRMVSGNPDRASKDDPHEGRFHLTAMLDLLDASSDSASIVETYESTMSQLVDITGMRGMAFVLNVDGTYLMVASSGLTDSLSGNIAEFRQEFSCIFTSLENETEPILFYDANNDEFFPAQFRHQMPYIDVVYIPIRHADILLGFLCMGKVEPGQWSADDLAFFSIIGQLSGIIIYRALVTERQRLQAIELERERTEARMRESIIQALGISVIEEQLNPKPDAPDGTSGATARLINSKLTPREKEVLRAVATGASNQEIARKLFISTGTVKMELQSILRKLNVRNRVEAAVYAVEAGLGRGI